MEIELQTHISARCLPFIKKRARGRDCGGGGRGSGGK